MSVTAYAAKFVELAKFYPHYTAENAEFSKCIKLENGLRADIKRAIGYQKIRNFSELVSSCRIYEEDTKAHYKVMSDRRGKGQQSRPKPYSALADKGKQKVNDERRPNRRDAPTEIVCFKCGEKCNTPFSQHKNIYVKSEFSSKNGMLHYFSKIHK